MIELLSQSYSSLLKTHCLEWLGEVTMATGEGGNLLIALYFSQAYYQV